MRQLIIILFKINKLVFLKPFNVKIIKHVIILKKSILNINAFRF